ncbi:MAG TPA: ComF family protein [Oscillospiraceae bacterium]|nr:ComF family protein [Oscillospiraceae bacterium]
MNGSLIKEGVLSLFFPKRCEFCDNVIDFRLCECKKCSDSVDKITGEVCLLCGFIKKDCVCLNHKHYYKAVAAPFYYEGAAGKAIRRLKHKHDEKAVKMFAKEMERIFDENFSNLVYDLITSVPLSKKSYNSRGYNQAELLAREFAKGVKLPYKETLVKTYETKPQHTLSKTERTGNLIGIFEPFIGNIQKGKRIILVDDVKTTGATLNECAKTLLIAGADEVICICAAITKNKRI